MKYCAVIFDLDGTVLINEEIYSQAFLEVLKKHGVSPRQLGDEHPQTPGIGLRENWEALKKRHTLPQNLSLDQLVHETQDIYHLNLDRVKIRPGFYQLYEALSRQQILLALATSNDRWLVEDELKDLDLEKYFSSLVTGEEVAYKKPAPDIFLEAAKKLGVEPAGCVVIEDSVAGVEAAKQAGMKCVVVLGSFTQEVDFPQADLVVESFDKLSPEVLETLFA